METGLNEGAEAIERVLEKVGKNEMKFPPVALIGVGVLGLVALCRGISEIIKDEPNS